MTHEKKGELTGKPTPYQYLSALKTISHSHVRHQIIFAPRTPSDFFTIDKWVFSGLSNEKITNRMRVPLWRSELDSGGRCVVCGEVPTVACCNACGMTVLS